MSSSRLAWLRGFDARRGVTEADPSIAEEEGEVDSGPRLKGSRDRRGISLVGDECSSSMERTRSRFGDGATMTSVLSDGNGNEWRH